MTRDLRIYNSRKLSNTYIRMANDEFPSLQSKLLQFSMQLAKIRAIAVDYHVETSEHLQL